MCHRALESSFVLFYVLQCELDIMFNLEKAHFILCKLCCCYSLLACWSCIRASLAAEMVMNGCIVETNKVNILKPILLLEKSYK